jgi:AraC family transcriptional regulator
MNPAGLIGHALAGRAAGGASLARYAPTLASHEVPPHCHDTAHVVAVERGHYLSSADGAAHAAPGDTLLVFNPPRVEHRDRFAPGQRLPAARFVALAIDWPLWLTLAGDADLPQRALAWHGSAAALWLARLRRVLQLPDATPADTEGLVAELAGAAATRREHRLDAVSPWLRQARDALRDDPAYALQPGGLARLARQIGVHPVHLARSFRAALGTTPGDYARTRRLQAAAARLLRSDEALAEVALVAGYFDQAHFTRAFSATFGLPPSRWRALHRR